MFTSFNSTLVAQYEGKPDAALVRFAQQAKREASAPTTTKQALRIAWEHGLISITEYEQQLKKG